MTTEPIDRDAIIRGYLQYADALGRGVPDDTPELDAAEVGYDTLSKIVRKGPPFLAWELVTELLRRAPDDQLDVHAAGPLEDVVRKWGTQLLARIEQEAAHDDRFRWALGCIWLAVDDLPPGVLERIVRASDGHIKPLVREHKPKPEQRAT